MAHYSAMYVSFFFKEQLITKGTVFLDHPVDTAVCAVFNRQTVKMSGVFDGSCVVTYKTCWRR